MTANPLPVATLNLVAEAGSAGFSTDLPLTFSWDVEADDRVAGYTLTVSDPDNGITTLLKTINDANQRTTQIIDVTEISGAALEILRSAAKVQFNLVAFNDAGETGSISVVEWMRPVEVVVVEDEIDPFGADRGDGEDDLEFDDEDDDDEV